MSLEYRPGTQWAVGDRLVQIDGPDSLTHMMVRDMLTGKILSVRIATLQPLPQAATGSDASKIPDIEWRRCAELANDLRPFTAETGISVMESALIADGCLTT